MIQILNNLNETFATTITNKLRKSNCHNECIIYMCVYVYVV